MKIKNKLKKFAIFMLAIAAIIIATSKPTPVYANDFTSPYSLELDGEWSEPAYLEDGVNDYYKFELTKAGYIDLKFMTYIDYNLTIRLYDSDYNQLDSFKTRPASAESPVVYSDQAVLSQGTYYVKVEGYKISSYDVIQGNYKLKAELTDYGVETIEDDSFDSPQTIYVDKEINSVMTYTNKLDWYKIKVPTDGRYRHIFNYAKFTLYDSDLIKIDSFVGKDGEKVIRDTELSAGTYYIKVEMDGWYAKYSYELRTIIPEKGDIIQTSSGTKYKVTKPGKKNGTVAYYRPSSTTKTSVTIPATVKIDGITYKVTSIDANAFQDNVKLKKVVVGKNIKTIGTRAFSGCTALKTVSFESGSALTTIKSRAFYNCKKLSTITLPSTLTKIDSYAFYKCTGLKKITIPSKVTTIGKQAFYKCSNLKTITIKTTKLTTSKVGEKAFSGIYKKATIKVPKSKLKAYKTLLKKKGVTTSAKFKSF